MPLPKNADALSTKGGLDGRNQEGATIESLIKAITLFGAHDNIADVPITGLGRNLKEWVEQTGKQISVTPVGFVATITFPKAFPRALHAVAFSADTLAIAVFSGYSATQFQVRRTSGGATDPFVVDYIAIGY